MLPQHQVEQGRKQTTEHYSHMQAHEKVRLEVSSRMRFSLLIFLSFILRFWNQILTCLSVRLTLLLISRRRSRVRYMLNRNSFSNSSVWCFVQGHLFFLPLFAVNQLLVGVSVLQSETDSKQTQFNMAHGHQIEQPYLVFAFFLCENTKHVY